MIQIIIILVSLIFSAFFSGMEIAFVSSNKLLLELDKKQEKSNSRIIGIFTQNPSRYIATMLIGNNISLVIYGIFMGDLIFRLLFPEYTGNNQTPYWILLVQTLISTLFILVTAEFIPKTIFRQNPNLLLNFFSYPILLFYIIFYPISGFTMFLSNTLLKKFFKLDINKQFQTTKVFGKVDLDDFLHTMQLELGSNEEIEPEIKIFKNALDFSNVKVRECMVPRTEIVAIESNKNIEEVKNLFIESGYSKILVYDNDIDNITGYLHSSDLFKNPNSIKSMIRPIIIVPETMLANKLLQELIGQNKSIAVIVDEFGGTSGIVTIEDIIEEITGEIEDEHDVSDFIDKKIADNEYIFSGRIEIDYINEKYNLNIPVKEEFETLAGFILYHYENIPKLNEIIRIESNKIYTLVILQVSKNRIDLVKMTVNDYD